MPASNAPAKTAMLAISKGLFREFEVEAPVFVSPLLPAFVPLLVGVWLFPTVGDAPAVGDAAGAVALAFAVGVTAGVVVDVGVPLGVMVGEGIGERCGVGEGDTAGAE